MRHLRQRRVSVCLYAQLQDGSKHISGRSKKCLINYDSDFEELDNFDSQIDRRQGRVIDDSGRVVAVRNEWNYFKDRALGQAFLHN